MNHQTYDVYLIDNVYHYSGLSRNIARPEHMVQAKNLRSLLKVDAPAM